MTEKYTWQSLGEITARMVANLEADQRRAFVRECERDGVLRRDQQAKQGERV